MKSNFPAKSKEHEARIRQIVQTIVESGKDKIAFVILFGSFARGNWTYDSYVEEGITYEYASDYDFLIITKTAKQASSSAGFDLERKIEKAVKYSLTSYSPHNAHYIIESIDHVNDELAKSQYFFSDIKKEGIVLYNSGEFALSEAKELNKLEREKIAKEDYQHWMEKAVRFLRYFEVGVEEDDLSGAAFNLHQAAESLYSCCLLTLGGYKPKSHNLKELNQLCAIYSHDFLTIFPQASTEQKECFKLLQQAYVEARYNKNYKITKSQLEYLIARVEKLKGLVEGVCGKN